MEKEINIIKTLILEILSSNKQANIFDVLITKIESYIDGQTAHNMIELKEQANDKKKKGDLFEAFCYLYIKNILKHDEVWMWKNIPFEIKQELSLNTTQDFGIDIVSIKNNNYYAIQCKYRKPKDSIQTIPWKSLSTFYGIVNKTGPWYKHVTMTNTNGCRHIGNKTEKDLSICIRTYQSLKSITWLKLINAKEQILDEHNNSSSSSSKKNKYITPSSEELREKRILFLSKLENIDDK
jgi:hypothetical protein